MMTFVNLREIKHLGPRIHMRLQQGKKPYIPYGGDIIEVPPCKCGNFKIWMTEEEKEEFMVCWQDYRAVNYSPEFVKARKMQRSHEFEMQRLGHILLTKLREDSNWRALKDKVDELKSKFAE